MFREGNSGPPAMRFAGRTLLAVLPVLALCLFTLACGPSRGELERTVAAYVEAVQALDARRLSRVSAVRLAMAGDGGEPAEASAVELLEARLDERLNAYLEQRSTGWLEFAPDGLVLIRALGLGRGTYYETVSSRQVARGRARLVQEVRLAYRSIDLSRLPPGTTIYLMGAPFGTIHRPVIGEGEATVRQVLERIWIDWELVQDEGGWKVLSVAPAARPAEAYADTRRY